MYLYTRMFQQCDHNTMHNLIKKQITTDAKPSKISTRSSQKSFCRTIKCFTYQTERISKGETGLAPCFFTPAESGQLYTTLRSPVERNQSDGRDVRTVALKHFRTCAFVTKWQYSASVFFVAWNETVSYKVPIRVTFKCPQLMQRIVLLKFWIGFDLRI